MAEKKKQKDPKKPSRTWRLLKVAMALLVAGGCAVGIWYGFTALGRDVHEMPMYAMTSQSLHLVDELPWMTPSIRVDLDVSARLPERFNLLDPDVCAEVAHAYEQIVWVERVVRVEKLDPRVDAQSLQIRLIYRRPVAFVGSAGKYSLVDRDGVRLPGVYTAAPRLGEVTLLVIQGVESAPPPPGRVWADRSLQAGVRVAEAVEPERERFKVALMDVSNVGGRRNRAEPEVSLYTRSTPPTRIKWGKAPSHEAEMLQEKTPAEKVDYLKYVYDKLNGRVDGFLEYIDVPNETIRRRATELTANETPRR